MLRKLSEEVADCYRRARQAREKAERASTEAEELDWLMMERRWLSLAEQSELLDRLYDFTAEAERARRRQVCSEL